MIKHKTILLILLFSITSIFLQGQTSNLQVIPVKEAIKQYLLINDKYYNTKSYEINVTYISYQDYKTLIPFETSSGFFKKYENNYCSKLLELYTIQNNNYKIIIDSAEKTINIANPSQVFESVFSLFDIETLFTNYAVVKTAKFSSGQLYRIELKFAYDIESYEYLVDESGWIKELTIYYNRISENKDGKVKYIKPRLQIKFAYYNDKVNDNEFDESRFFNKRGENLVLTKKYKDFQLIDHRVYTDNNR